MSTAGSASSASAKERLINPTDCTRNGEKTSVDKPVHQKQTHAPRTTDLNDSPALPSGYLRKAALRKYPPPPKKKDEASVISTLLLFSLCVALWMQRRGCSLPGVYRAQEEYSEQTTRPPSSVVPLLCSGRSFFHGKPTTWVAGYADD